MSASYAVGARERASSIASNVLSPANINDAQNFAKQSAAEFRRNIDEGSWSLRLLALVAALAMMVVSVLGVIADVITLKWISVVFQVYIFAFGVVILVLESSRQLSCFQRLETNLYKYALFVKYVWGRGVLYFFAGTLMISLRDFMDLVRQNCLRPTCADALFAILGGRSIRLLRWHCICTCGTLSCEEDVGDEKEHHLPRFITKAICHGRCGWQRRAHIKTIPQSHEQSGDGFNEEGNRICISTVSMWGKWTCVIRNCGQVVVQ